MSHCPLLVERWTEASHNKLAEASLCFCYPLSLFLTSLLGCNLTDVENACLFFLVVLLIICVCMRTWRDLATGQCVITHIPGAFTLCLSLSAINMLLRWKLGVMILLLLASWLLLLVWIIAHYHLANNVQCSFFLPALYRTSVAEHGSIYPVKGSIFTGFGSFYGSFTQTVGVLFLGVYSISLSPSLNHPTFFYLSLLHQLWYLSPKLIPIPFAAIPSLTSISSPPSHSL